MSNIKIDDVSKQLQKQANFMLDVARKIESLTEEQFLTLLERYSEIPQNFLVYKILENVPEALKTKLEVLKLDDDQLSTLFVAIDANDDEGGKLTMSDIVNFLGDEDLVRKLGSLSDDDLQGLLTGNDLLDDNAILMEIIAVLGENDLSFELQRWTDEDLYLLMDTVMDLEDPE